MGDDGLRVLITRTNRAGLGILVYYFAMTKNLQRVVWAKGMLLTPQHFQSLDNYIDDTLHFRFAASAFANWGITDIGFDEEALADGRLTITTLRGVMSDGSPLDCPTTDAPPPTTSFGQHFGST